MYLDPVSEETTHLSVVDAAGHAVSLTYTLEESYGSSITVPGAGFLLNNELTDFNSVPQANPDPADFNPGANDVAPFKRPRSSMAPTMVFRGKRPLAAYGSPGGSTSFGPSMMWLWPPPLCRQEIGRASCRERV